MEVAGIWRYFWARSDNAENKVFLSAHYLHGSILKSAHFELTYWWSSFSTLFDFDVLGKIWLNVFFDFLLKYPLKPKLL